MSDDLARLSGPELAERLEDKGLPICDEAARRLRATNMATCATCRFHVLGMYQDRPHCDNPQSSAFDRNTRGDFGCNRWADAAPGQALKDKPPR